MRQLQTVGHLAALQNAPPADSADALSASFREARGLLAGAHRLFDEVVELRVAGFRTWLKPGRSDTAGFAAWVLVRRATMGATTPAPEIPGAGVARALALLLRQLRSGAQDLPTLVVPGSGEAEGEAQSSCDGGTAAGRAGHPRGGARDEESAAKSARLLAFFEAGIALQGQGPALRAEAIAELLACCGLSLSRPVPTRQLRPWSALHGMLLAARSDRARGSVSGALGRAAAIVDDGGALSAAAVGRAKMRIAERRAPTA